MQGHMRLDEVGLFESLLHQQFCQLIEYLETTKIVAEFKATVRKTKPTSSLLWDREGRHKQGH